MFDRIVSEKVRRNFEKKLRVTPGCWLWTGAIGHAGYARFGYQGKNCIASRISYRLYVGEIVDEMNILHSCDNPKCVNPYHLRQGTHADNTNDKMVRGRHRGRHRLTADQVIAIRDDQRTLAAIAEEYGVSFQNIYNIRSGRSWKVLGPPPSRPRSKHANHGSRRWTVSEVQALRDRYQNEAVSIIAADMGRTRGQLMQKAHELGIRKRPLQSAIARATGVQP